MDGSLALMGLLSSEPGYGYDLKHRYDRFFGVRKPLAFGQVYAALGRMLRDGYVRTMGEEPGAGPDRKRYEITASGRGRVSDWLYTADEPVTAALSSNLFAKVIVALLTGQDAGKTLDLQRMEHMERMRELTELKQDADLLHTVLYDRALFHLEADLRWIDTTEARLTELAREVTQ